MSVPGLLLYSLNPTVDIPRIAAAWMGGFLLLVILGLLLVWPKQGPEVRAAFQLWLVGIGALAAVLFHLLAAREAWLLRDQLAALGARAHEGDWGRGIERVARAQLFGWLLLLLTLGGVRLAGAIGRPLRPAAGPVVLVLAVLLLYLLVVFRASAVDAAFEARWGPLAAPAPAVLEDPGQWHPGIGEFTSWMRREPPPSGNLLGLLPPLRILLLPAALAAVLGFRDLLRVARGRTPWRSAPWSPGALGLQAAAFAAAMALIDLLVIERCAVLARWGRRAPPLDLLLDGLLPEALPALAVAWLSLGTLMLGARERWGGSGEGAVDGSAPPCETAGTAAGEVHDGSVPRRLR